MRRRPTSTTAASSTRSTRSADPAPRARTPVCLLGRSRAPRKRRHRQSDRSLCASSPAGDGRWGFFFVNGERTMLAGDPGAPRHQRDARFRLESALEPGIPHGSSSAALLGRLRLRVVEGVFAPARFHAEAAHKVCGTSSTPAPIADTPGSTDDHQQSSQSLPDESHALCGIQ